MSEWLQLTGVLSRAQIEKNQELGLMPKQGNVGIYADGGHHGLFNQGWRFEPPQNPATPPGKMHAFTDTALRDQNSYLALDSDKPALSAKNPATLSDAIWGTVWGPAASRMSNLYTQYAELIDGTGGIPNLIVKTVDRAEARRINMGPALDNRTPAVPYPIGNHDGDWRPFLPAYVIRFRPGTSIVEAMEYQVFAAWARTQVVSASGTRPSPRLKVPVGTVRQVLQFIATQQVSDADLTTQILSLVE